MRPMNACKQNPVVLLERINVTSDGRFVSGASVKREYITDLVRQLPKCESGVPSAGSKIDESFFNSSHSRQHEAQNVATEGSAFEQVATLPFDDLNDQNCCRQQSNLPIKKEAALETDNFLSHGERLSLQCDAVSEDYERPLVVINCTSLGKNGLSNVHNGTALPSSSINSKNLNVSLNRSHSDVHYDSNSIKLKDLRVVLVDLFPDKLRAEFKKQMTLANETSSSQSSQQSDGKISTNGASHNSLRKNFGSCLGENVVKHEPCLSADEVEGSLEKRVETDLNTSQCMTNGADISSSMKECSLRIKQEISSKVREGGFEIRDETSWNINKHSLENIPGTGVNMNECSSENESVDKGLCPEYSDDCSYVSRPISSATSEDLTMYTQHSHVNSSAFLHSHSEQVKCSANTKFCCSFCPKKFSSTNELQHHLVEHDKRLYTCTVCPRAFPSSSKLKMHLASHSDERPYSCEICSRTFKLKKNRARHVKHMHSDENDFSCAHCLARFKRSDLLQRHLVTHRERPFSCNLCSKAFSLPRSLTLHMASHKPCPHDVCFLGENCPARFVARSPENGQKTVEYLETTDLEKHTDKETSSQDTFLGVSERSERGSEDGSASSRMGVHLIECNVATQAQVTPNSSECVFGGKGETSNLMERNLVIQTGEILNVNENCSENSISLSENECGVESRTGWIKSECISGYQAGSDRKASEDSVQTQIAESQNIIGGNSENLTEASSNICGSSDIPTETNLMKEPSLGIQIEASWSMNESENDTRTNSEQGLHPGFPDKCSDNPKSLHSAVSLNQSAQHSHAAASKILSPCSKPYISVKSHSTNAYGYKLSCIHCPQQCSSRDELIDHYMKEHVDYNPSCTFYTKPLGNTSAPQRRSETHSNTDQFICVQCSKSFAQKRDLTRHLKIVHSDSGPFFCPLCPAGFKSNRGLKEHYRTHGNDKSFSCVWCLKALSCPSTLKRHMAACQKRRATDSFTSENQGKISPDEHAWENQIGARSVVNQGKISSDEHAWGNQIGARSVVNQGKISSDEHAWGNQIGARSVVNQCSFENYARMSSKVEESSRESLVKINSTTDVENNEELEELIRITSKFKKNQPETRLSEKEPFLENRPETVWIQDEGCLANQPGTGPDMEKSMVENELETVWLRDEGSFGDQQGSSLSMEESLAENQPEVTLTGDEGSSAQKTSLDRKETSSKIQPEIILIEDETIEDEQTSSNTKGSSLENEQGLFWIRDRAVDGFEVQTLTQSNTEGSGLEPPTTVWVRDEVSLEAQPEISRSTEESSSIIRPVTVWIQNAVSFEDQQEVDLEESSSGNEPETVWISDDDGLENQACTESSVSESNLQNQVSVNRTNKASLECGTSLGLADECHIKSGPARPSILERLLLEAKCARGRSEGQPEHSSKQVHAVNATGNLFNCTQCPKGFPSRATLINHSVEHFGETPSESILGMEPLIEVNKSDKDRKSSCETLN